MKDSYPDTEPAQTKQDKTSNRGYYLMSFGAGRYTSIGWYLTYNEAFQELTRLINAGHWSGMKPRIERA